MTLIFQSLIDGLLIGGVYAAIGIGLTLAYGVMGVVNWSHGEALMMALYISFFLTKYAAIDPYATIAVNCIVLGIFGYFVQKFIFNRLINREGKAWMNILLFTAGISIAFQAIANMFFGAEVKSVITRYAGMLHWGDILVSKPKAISFILAIVFTAILYIFIQRSEMGRAIRATAQDRKTAQLMGINSNSVFNISFALSMILVGISGSLLIPFYSVHPYVGASFTFKSFIIVSLGGKGNIMGALAAGIAIGIIEKIGGVIFDDNIAQTFIFAVFIIILLVRPDGILTRKKG